MPLHHHCRSLLKHHLARAVKQGPWTYSISISFKLFRNEKWQGRGWGGGGGPGPWPKSPKIMLWNLVLKSLTSSMPTIPSLIGQNQVSVWQQRDKMGNRQSQSMLIWARDVLTKSSQQLRHMHADRCFGLHFC